MKGRLLIFSAPSGAGKTTIVRHLLQSNLNLEFSVSATSRKPRPGEVNGKDYLFLTEQEFKMKIGNNEFLEWEEVYEGTYYGTLKKSAEEIIERGINVIFDVDVVGGLNIKKHYGSEALSVFVQPPSVEELRKRLTKRSTETEESLKTRIAKAEYEMGFADRFDIILINNNLNDTLAEAVNIVEGFLNRKQYPFQNQLS